MTIKEIKTELQNKIAQLQSISLDLQDSGELAICFTILSRLNDLGAPPLQWRQISESEWVAFHLPDYTYMIEDVSDEGTEFTAIDHGGYISAGGIETLDQAQVECEKLWQELYRQFIAL